MHTPPRTGPAWRSELRGLALTAALAAACQAEPGEGSAELPPADERVLPIATHALARPPAPTRRYEPPAERAIFTSPGGDDTSGDGSEGSPYRTLGRALQDANARPASAEIWSVVLKEGVYREGELTIVRDHVRVQRYRADAVTLRGSVALGGFTGSGPYTKTVTELDPAPLLVDCADAPGGEPGTGDPVGRAAGRGPAPVLRGPRERRPAPGPRLGRRLGTGRGSAARGPRGGLLARRHAGAARAAPDRGDRLARQDARRAARRRPR